jgi:hypothetical protein
MLLKTRVIPWMITITLANAFLSPLRVTHGIDVHNKWYAIFTNVKRGVVTTRINGTLMVRDRKGRVVNHFKIPIGGIHLKESESCMTQLSTPLDSYTQPVTVTCSIDFIDLDDGFMGHLSHVSIPPGRKKW